jgi:serine/threonine-protein kinase RsbW
MSGPGTIELNVPLRAEHASHLRLLMASVASDAGFTVDEIDDLRLGASEVFTLLLDAAGGADARAEIELTVDGRGISVKLCMVGDSAVPEIDTLATTILTSVVDDFTLVPGGVMMSKRAVESSPAP